MSTDGPSGSSQTQSEKSAASVEARPGPSLSSLNHVSFLCADVDRTKKFYRDLLGFVEVKRPESFKFEGSWCARPTEVPRHAHRCINEAKSIAQPRIFHVLHIIVTAVTEEANAMWDSGTLR